ncbi:MAG: RelA/SpoT family protein [Candidatus Glassbacteria bacterium]
MDALIKKISSMKDRLDLELIEKAYLFSGEAHSGQRRRSGDEFISHPTGVVEILLDLNLDSITIASALIHDVVEDTPKTLEDVRDTFGEEIAMIVDGLTKISSFSFTSLERRQVENYRKMLLSISRDIRIMLIKLADRLHNMRTLESLPSPKRERIALETREIYAPLAHRFGIAKMKAELEDLSFKYLEPGEYKKLEKLVDKKNNEKNRLLQMVMEPLSRELKEAGIRAEIKSRMKHLFSIYRKMQMENRAFEEIYDLMAIRILVGTVKECYHVLGIIHSLWTPLGERFKDYIATPKPNMYQSLHTTIFGPEGQLFEFQIRTHEMHRTAEYGIAAHWKYKEGKIGTDPMDDRLSWFRQVLELLGEMTDPKDFMDFLKIDIFQREIFVFTPKGDLKELPAGSTPIDFAFAVHTEIGFRCAGARVNGVIAPLSRKLKSGDKVEIITSPRAKPKRDWLSMVKTSGARSKIRQFLREEEAQKAIGIGREVLEKEARRLGIPKPVDRTLEKAAKAMRFKSVRNLIAGVGRGDVSAYSVLKLVYGDKIRSPRVKSISLRKSLKEKKAPDAPIKVAGIENVMVRYSQCCQPIPGDDVRGYITKGQGISIHRVDCPNIKRSAIDSRRVVDIDWRGQEGTYYLTKLIVTATDRKGLVADIAGAIAETSTNIGSAVVKTKGFEFVGTFLVDVMDTNQLEAVVKAIKKVEGILNIDRGGYSPRKKGR